MTHHTTGAGRPYVECDEPVIVDTRGPVRCGRRSYGRRDRFDDGPELSMWDLATGWSVAPYPDDYDHGATRTSLLDGSSLPPIPTEVGLFGDLHTCPTCRSRQRRGLVPGVRVFT